MMIQMKNIIHFFFECFFFRLYFWKSWHFQMIHRMFLRSLVGVSSLCPAEMTMGYSSSGYDSQLCLSIIFFTIYLSVPLSLCILLRIYSELSRWPDPKNSFSLTVSYSQCRFRTNLSNFSLNYLSEIHFFGEQVVLPAEFYSQGCGFQSLWQNFDDVCEYILPFLSRIAMPLKPSLTVVASMRVMSYLVDWLLTNFLVRQSSSQLITSCCFPFCTFFRPPARAIFSIQRIFGSRAALADGGTKAGGLMRWFRWARREEDRLPKNLRLKCKSKGPHSVRDARGLAASSSLITLFIIIPRPSKQRHCSETDPMEGWDNLVKYSSFEIWHFNQYPQYYRKTTSSKNYQFILYSHQYISLSSSSYPSASLHYRFSLKCFRRQFRDIQQLFDS